MEPASVELQIGVVADDLSGATECAARAIVRVSRSSVLLNCFLPLTGEGVVVTLDIDTRSRDSAESTQRASAAARAVSHAPVVVKKVDSLLRGHLAAEVAAMAACLGRVPVVAVANPRLSRTVRGGVLHVGAAALHETDLWRAEPTPAPPSVSHALHPLSTAVVPQSTVSKGVSAVARALTDAATSGRVPVCDAHSDADLDTIRDAALLNWPEVLLVGSAAFADSAVRGCVPVENTISQITSATAPRVLAHGARHPLSGAACAARRHP